MSSNRVSIDTNVIMFRTIMDGGPPKPLNYLTVIKDIGQITYIPPLEHFSSYGVGYLPSTLQNFLTEASTICGTIIPFPSDTVPSSYVFSTLSTIDSALNTLTVQLGAQVSTVCTSMVALSNSYAANVATKVPSSLLISSQNGMLSTIAKQEAQLLSTYGTVSTAERLYSTLASTINGFPFASYQAQVVAATTDISQQIQFQQQNISSVGLSREDQILTVSTNIQNLSNSMVAYSNYLDQQTQGLQMSSFSSSVFAPTVAIYAQLAANTVNLNNMSTYLYNSTITKSEFIDFSTLVYTDYFNITYESLSSLSAPLGTATENINELAAYVVNDTIRPAEVSSLSTQIGINHGPFYPDNISSISTGIAISYSNINQISTAAVRSTFPIVYYSSLVEQTSTQVSTLIGLSQEIYATTLQSTTLAAFWNSYWTRGSPIDGVLSTQLISSTQGIYDNAKFTNTVRATQGLTLGAATAGTAAISSFIYDPSYININTSNLNVNNIFKMESGFNQSKTADITVVQSGFDYFVNSNVAGVSQRQTLGQLKPYGLTTDGGYSLYSTPTYFLAFGIENSYLQPSEPPSNIQTIPNSLSQISDAIFNNGAIYQAGQANGQAAIQKYTLGSGVSRIIQVPSLTRLTSLTYDNALIVSGISGAYDYFMSYSYDDGQTWTLLNLNTLSLGMKYVSAVRRVGIQTVILGRSNDPLNPVYVVRIDDLSSNTFSPDRSYQNISTNDSFRVIDIATNNAGIEVAIICPGNIQGNPNVSIVPIINSGGQWKGYSNPITNIPVSQSGSIRIFYQHQQALWVIQGDKYIYTKQNNVIETTQAWAQIPFSSIFPIPICPGYYTLPTRSLYFNAKTNVATQIIQKTSGSFEIPHTDPDEAAKGTWLRHCFVEAPTRGDNIYRFRVQGPAATIELPEYFAALNENVQTFVSAEDVLTDVWAGPYDPEANTVRVYSATPATLNVLVIGTRRDPGARKAFDECGGVEFKQESH